MDAYEYDELPLNAFRYLVLLPGAGTDPLRCNLYTSTIDQVRYESVSYVWGTDERDKDIFCDGKVLKITPNLYKVLQRVRLPHAPRTLWADSICIDQNDLNEKSRQVSIMGQIYRNAERVLIWMGTAGDEHGPSVFSLLNDISEMISTALTGINGRIDQLKSNGEWQSEWNPWDWFPFSDADAPVLSDSRWASLNVLVEQEWFQRGWVVREAGLARQGLVIWGQTEFSWEDLMRALVWRHRRAVKTIPIPAEDRFRSHLEAYEAQHESVICIFYQEGSWRSCSLLDYLHFARALRLKDPRDRIYAFLDLAEDSTRRLCITPNYSDTPSKVYRDFAIQYVRAIGDISILNYVKHDEDSLESEFMTWAPDWSKEEDNFIGFVSTDDNHPPLRSRTGETFEPSLVNEVVLKVKGAVVDCVRFASDVLQGRTTTLEDLFKLWTLIRQSNSGTPYPSSNLLEAFFDAIAIAGYYGDLAEWLQARGLYISVFKRLSSQLQEVEQVTWDANEVAKLESSMFHGFISSTTSGKRVIITERGYIGLAPHVTRKGDLCVILFGCPSPVLLRVPGGGTGHIYLGPGFILGKESFDLGESGTGFYSCLGVEDSKDWLEWDVEEQDFYLI